MQGVFAERDDDDDNDDDESRRRGGTHRRQLTRLGVDWADSLNPPVDEPTQRAVRDAEARAAHAHSIHQFRTGNGGVGAVPVPPIPVAPPARFVVKGMTFIVINTPGARDTNMIKPRPGQWGHYIVPYVVDKTTNKASPYTPHEKKNDTDVTVKEGFPGKSADGKDKNPQPDGELCKMDLDFITPTREKYWEVGIEYVRAVLEQAEAADLAFARRMEGLGFVSRSEVWDCIDPDYDASDREAVITQFMSKYLERFYTRLEPGNIPDIEKVSAEALHKHKVFCKAWTKKHYQTLTPAVTSPAEVMASEFYQDMLRFMVPRERKLTRMELARVLMRHPELCTEFASALHFYVGSLEQSSGGRNANYKQVSMTTASRVNSYRLLGDMLSDNGSLLHKIIRELCTVEAHYLHPLSVDWYDILGQMPPIHRYFDDPSQFQVGGGRRRGYSSEQLPPWLVSRTF